MGVNFDNDDEVFNFAMGHEPLSDSDMQTWALKFIVGYMQKHKGKSDSVRSQRRAQMLKQLAGTIARLPIPKKD